MENEKRTFTPGEFQCLKGYLALGVLIHHLSQFTGFFVGTPRIWNVCMGFGRWCVAGFLFMSGYGLICSRMQKGDAYVNAFLKKRLMPFYVMYAIYTVLYILYALLWGSEITAKSLVQSFTFGSTIFSFGWYFQVTYILYFFFYLVFRLVKGDKASFGVFILGLCIIMIGLWIWGYPYALQISIFLLGSIVAYHRESVVRIMENKVFLQLCGNLLGFLTTYVFASRALAGQYSLSALQIELIKIAEGIFFCFLLLNSLMLFRSKGSWVIRNRVSAFLGKYSLELYAVQGFVLVGVYKYVNNMYLYAVICLCLEVALAWVAYTIRQQWKKTRMEKSNGKENE